MVNKARGEVAMRRDGKAVALVLNLGALAAIEEAFGAESYEDVFADVLNSEKVSATKVQKLLVAVAEANGEDVGDALNAMTPEDVTKLALDLLARAFPEAKPGRKGKTQNP